MIWLDLEATIILEWENPILVHESLWDSLFGQCCTKRCDIGIFSFAIWDDNDRERFNKQIKPFLEERFPINIIEVPTKEEVFKVVKAHIKRGIDFNDFTELWDKERAFIDFMRGSNRTGEHRLFDDMVQDLKVFGHDLSIIFHKVG